MIILFTPLNTIPFTQDIELDVTSNKTLAESLNNVTRDNNPFFNSMLRIMTTRCMMQALYFCSGTLEPPEYNHYGLATPTYTHFTSPIRRYKVYYDFLMYMYLSSCSWYCPASLSIFIQFIFICTNA